MVQTLEDLKNDIPSEVVQKTKELIALKLKGVGKDKYKEISVLDDYFKLFEQEYYNNESYPFEKKEMNLKFFDKFLQDLLIKNEK